MLALAHLLEALRDEAPCKRDTLTHCIEVLCTLGTGELDKREREGLLDRLTST